VEAGRCRSRELIAPFVILHLLKEGDFQ
jgi:hypothetical protein